MTRPATPPVIVMLHPQLPVEDVTELLGCLASLGTGPPVVRQQPVLRDPADLSWWILVIAPLSAFLATLGTRLASDAYDQLGRALRRLQDRHRAADGRPRSLVLRDTGTGLEVILEPGLPAAAYRQLAYLDVTRLGPGPVCFREGEWRSTNSDAR